MTQALDRLRPPRCAECGATPPVLYSHRDELGSRWRWCTQCWPQHQSEFLLKRGAA